MIGTVDGSQIPDDLPEEFPVFRGNEQKTAALPAAAPE